MRADTPEAAAGMGREVMSEQMRIEAMGGPHDGALLAVPEAVRTIEFVASPSPAEIEVAKSFHNTDNPPMPKVSVVYDVVEWYSGIDVDGNEVPIRWVVLAPTRWPGRPDPRRPSHGR